MTDMKFVPEEFYVCLRPAYAKSPVLEAVSGVRCAPLVYLRCPKWIDDEFFRDEIVPAITIRWPAGVEIMRTGEKL